MARHHEEPDWMAEAFAAEPVYNVALDLPLKAQRTFPAKLPLYEVIPAGDRTRETFAGERCPLCGRMTARGLK